MPPKRATLLCRYQYDPLDRLTTCTLSVAQGVQRFYLENRLVTEVEGQLQWSIFQYQDQLLGQLARYNGAVGATLLATDQQRSALNALGAKRQSNSFAYSPYGHRLLEGGLPGLPGFTGEKPDPVTGHYLLGNGYRGFNAVLMRFNSPDSLSPFGEGGMNAYAYCSGDPVNREDRTGHVWGFLKKPLRALGFKIKSKGPPVSMPKSSVTQVGEPHRILEQAGLLTEPIAPTPFPHGISVRDVPHLQIRLKEVAYNNARSSSARSSHTITVANERGEFVANYPISDRDRILIKLSISTFPAPSTLLEKSEVLRGKSAFIRKLVWRDQQFPPGWTFQRLEDL